VEFVEKAVKNAEISVTGLCQKAELPYSSLMRWKKRLKDGEPVLQVPGPKKVRTPDMGRLMAEIDGIRHRNNRSLGAFKLYRNFSEVISRRDFMGLVEMARKEKKAEARQLMRRIQWHTPGIVWAMDDTEYGRDYYRRKLFLHGLRDLGSRYTFPPLSSKEGVLHGEKVAANLGKMFKNYGAPLFLKRDNGSNLNHKAVDQVLNEHFVISLNSPKYYAPYNGSIEELQSELKSGLYEKLVDRPFLDVWTLGDAAGTSAHDLNHKKREVLAGKTACERFFSEKGGDYSRRQRERIFELLNGMAGDIIKGMKEDRSQLAYEAAWRISVETWLHNQGHICVSVNEKVLPYFFPILSHD